MILPKMIRGASWRGSGVLEREGDGNVSRARQRRFAYRMGSRLCWRTRRVVWWRENCGANETRSSLVKKKTRDEEEEAAEPEASKWIHRDKLAKIEGNEAKDYMYDVGSSRWIHKDKLERIEIHELQRAGISPNDLPVLQDGPGGARTAGEGGDVSFYELHTDIRTPEEKAAGMRYNVYRQFRRNASSSRIPLASASPHPIPQQYLERTAPLPRSTVSPAGSDEDNRVSITIPSARKRSHSTSSAQLLEDVTAGPTTPPNGKTGAAITNPKIRMSANRRTSNTSSSLSPSSAFLFAASLS